MSVNGVTSGVNQYQAYAETSAETSAKAGKENEAKKSSQEFEKGVTYSSKMTEDERAKLVEYLKRENQVQIDSFKSMVEDMFQKQGLAVKNSDDIWSMLASGNFSVDKAAAQKAKDLISEDGYWGVDQTSDRIFQMAKALSGGDEKGMDEMLKAFEKGYKQATKTWGRQLPDISKQTYDAVHEKFKQYQESLKNDPAQNPTI